MVQQVRTLSGLNFDFLRHVADPLHPIESGQCMIVRRQYVVLNYLAPLQNLLQLKTNDTRMIPDDYRKQQISYMTSVPKILRRQLL